MSVIERNYVKNIPKILSIIICLNLFIAYNKKVQNAFAEKIQSIAQAEELFVVPPIPQTILNILETEPDNFSYQMIKYYLETFPIGEYSIARAMGMAIWSGNEKLIAEIIKHYKDIYESGVEGYKWKNIDICDAQKANINIVKMLMDSGLDLTHDHGWNEVTHASQTILAQFAYANDDPAVLQLLIDHGAQVNTKVHTPRGWPKEFYEFSSVYNAAQGGKAGNLQLLIANGGNIHLRGSFTDKTPLIAAAESGSDECVEILLKAGADVMALAEERNRTALMEAAASGNERSVELLLENGAKETINFQDSIGTTALMEAAISGNPHSLRMIINYGANVNMALSRSSYAKTDYSLHHAPSGGDEGGQTALMMASTYECVKMLLESGADVNAVDKAGRNALLFHCFFYRNSEIVKLLIDAGSYLYLDKDNGKNLLYLARAWSNYNDNSEITEMLIKAGCIDDNSIDPYNGENYDYSFSRPIK